MVEEEGQPRGRGGRWRKRRGVEGAPWRWTVRRWKKRGEVEVEEEPRGRGGGGRREMDVGEEGVTVEEEERR